jgi:hypothetical protein
LTTLDTRLIVTSFSMKSSPFCWNSTFAID